jgi:RND superfamily putative drug exporter
MTTSMSYVRPTIETETDSSLVVRLVRSAARAAQRRPKTIIAFWLLFVVGCTAAGAMVGTKSLTSAQSEVGQSARADRLVHRAGIDDPAVESVLVTSASASATAEAASALQTRLAATTQTASVQGPAQSAALSTDGGRIVLVQVTMRGDPEKAADHVTPIEDAVAAVQHTYPGVQLREAGPGTAQKAITDLIGNDLSRAERLSLPITLLILVLAFGALVAASVPLLLGLTSVAAALGALGVVSHVVPNSDSTSAVIVLVGLAVGVDYSLFYVRREREERRRGLPEARPRRKRGAPAPAVVSRQESALQAAAASVGRAIVVSGLTVVVALAGLMITGQGDFVSMGLGTILVVLIAVIGSLTVLPATLALLGDRVDRGRLPGYRWMRERRDRREAAAGQPLGLWARLARAVTARPGASLVTSGCILAALAVPLFGMKTANLTANDLPQNLPVVQALNAIEASFPGAPMDAGLVVQGHDLQSATARSGLAALGQRALHITGGRGTVTVTVSSDGTVARVGVPMPERSAAVAKKTVTQLRSQVAAGAASVPGVRGAAMVTGDAASSLDYSNRMSSATPEVIAFVLVLGFLLLVLTFRAPLLAASVMMLNLLSIGAAYGILVAVFQHTWAEHLLSFKSTGHVINWLPLFMFVILFGLSMDYTILVLERIREARMRGLSPRQAAAEGVSATAGTVTSAAVVMVAVFSIFAALDVINFKQLGVGLAAAVLLDATVVRGVALPAVVTLLGKRGWPVRGSTAAPKSGGLSASQWDDAAVESAEIRGRA